MELFTVSLLITLLLLYQLIKCVMRMKKLKNLSDRPVVITGCDMGLGYDLALALCKFNIPTFATCLTDKAMENLREKAQGLPGAKQFWLLQMDVRDNESCKKTAQFVKETVGENGLWAVVCNAGILGYPVIDDWLTPEIYSDVLSVNLVGTIRTCQLFRRMLLPMKGRIIFISSMLGKFGAPSLGPYCVSKFGVEAYADINRHETRMLGITVHVIAPGFFTTNLNDNRRIYELVEKAWKETSQEARDMYGEAYKERLKATMVEGVKGTAVEGTRNVVEACVHALTARYPKPRYPLGLDGHFFYWLSLCPTGFQNWFIDFWYSFSGAPIPNYYLNRISDFKLGFLERRRIMKQNETWEKAVMANGLH